ncbi:class I SAM-dependent methyltransferase [Aquiflexum gelatinilyticum]|uniref:class I SAM-dependent methyltransferase n=1 Tax=Aquiflexum gelatinilyticum TaxID=2961943 RepID=UPI0021694C28|nr:class I SAM-dependent methyltransferase [Aquiflexum gelatinilyticum]MCS4434482.1 class I SAM-dependent methyltransferase [Aquiflexum gelatinilyticum]
MFYSKLKRLLKQATFLGSEQYWENRYNKGGNSGSGSYGHLAEFKGSVINDFLKENKIQSVVEFGCGDGNQLRYLQIQNYLGFDISKSAIELCRTQLRKDKSKGFKLTKDYQDDDKAELVLSLDVIFHLIEDEVFENYMNRLFSSSLKFVIIYSSDTDKNTSNCPPHFKNRDFSIWIENNFSSFKLIKRIPNKYPFNGTEMTSVSDFYIYERIEDIYNISDFQKF